MRKKEAPRTRHTCTICSKKREKIYMIWIKRYNNGGHWKCKECKEENHNFGHPYRLSHSYTLTAHNPHTTQKERSKK